MSDERSTQDDMNYESMAPEALRGETLTALRAQWAADTTKHEQSLADLQAALKLPAPPNRIECYDISNSQGTASVACMVVSEHDPPNKDEYRQFTI